MTTNSSAPSATALHHFEQLRGSSTAVQLVSLQEDIDRHLLRIQKLALQNEMTPLDLAEAVAGGLHSLLDQLNAFPSEHQTAILGAALYFVSHEDEFPDLGSILGLDDDAAIFNYVVHLIGRPELEVQL